jgi:hypothetical protein
VSRVHELRRELGTEASPYAINAALPGPPDLDGYKRLRDAGVTDITNIPWSMVGPPSSTVAFKRDALERFAEECIVPMAED